MKDTLTAILVEATGRIMPEVGPDLGEYTARLLRHRGIDVRLNTKVVKVDASRADRITLTTAAGGTFTARRVIVTVPLGVLQHKVITFVPPLPAANQNAINSLGMGLLSKVCGWCGG